VSGDEICFGLRKVQIDWTEFRATTIGRFVGKRRLQLEEGAGGSAGMQQTLGSPSELLTREAVDSGKQNQLLLGSRADCAEAVRSMKRVEHSMEHSMSFNGRLGSERDQVVKKGNVMRMYVVRHAEHVTPAQAHLSRKGSLQAVAVANTLKRKRKVSAVYTSPRSIETAQTICKELELNFIKEEALLPYNAGSLTGLSMEQVQESMPEVYKQRYVERNPDFKVPQGESLNDRFARVKSFLMRMVEKHRGEQIVVVTHGGIIDDMFRNARSISVQVLTHLKKPYGSLSCLKHTDGHGFEEEYWAAVDHLPEVVAESPTGGQLYLFPHQVAGSFPMLRGDLGELCKPATQAEMDVYEAFERECPQVAKFAPGFLGKVVIDVKHILENEKALCRPLEIMHAPERPQSPAGSEVEDNSVGSCGSGKRPHSGSADVAVSNEMKRQKIACMGEEVESAMTDAASCGSQEQLDASRASSSRAANCASLMACDADDEEEQDESEMKMKPVTRSNLSDGRPGPQRAWSVTTLWDRFIEHRKKKVVEAGEGKFVYLVMENMTHGLSRPHILDLKMGIQQHGANESEEKKAAKRHRVETTTSKTMGARIGGMQLFDEKQQSFVLRDKYWGRSLDQQGLVDALHSFVEGQNGKIRVNVVKDIILQLDTLEQAVRSTSWKFYGCSLLLVYDSSDAETRRDRLSSSSSDHNDDQRLLKPAWCRARSRSFDHVNLSSSRRCHEMLKSSIESDLRDLHVGSSPSTPPSNDSLFFNGDAPFTRSRSMKMDFCVSVRLIDFAKCEMDLSENSFDEGMIFGIRNLRKIFSRFLLVPKINRRPSV